MYLCIPVANGQVLTKVSEATANDVDIAVEAAQKAFDTTWGLNAPGSLRASLLNKLATLMEEHHDKLAAVEALDGGKLHLAIPHSPRVLRQYIWSL